MKIFHKLFAWFLPKKETGRVVTATFGEAEEMTISETAFKDYLLSLLRQTDGVLSHENLQAAARIFLNTDIPSNFWKLRYATESMMFFKICHVYSKFEDNVLKDIQLTMEDDSMGTSLKLVVMVSDLPEVMVPFIPNIDVKIAPN